MIDLVLKIDNAFNFQFKYILHIVIKIVVSIEKDTDNRLIDTG